MAAPINPLTYSLPSQIAEAVTAALHDWDTHDKTRKLWARDASLWTGADEDKWLGWLSIVTEQQKNATRFTKFAEEVEDAGFSHALLLGMGGSSLCPEVFRKTFGKIEGFPELHVLDSTDPAQINAVENQIDLTKTLFFVSSKSGTTLEPNIFKQYFFERVRQAVGDKAGERFVADHRSRIEVAASGGERSVSQDFSWEPRHWRSLLRAF